MSTHKHFDKICCAVMAVVLLLTVLLMNGEMLGIQKQDVTMGYEEKLFDTSQVHTIDIVMDDWEGFLDTCTNEEYTLCSVVIDGEAYKNVAIRAKGNTSLTQVASYGNDRYSFKIEFDHYDSGKTYYGLDKLCLNNIIQDNTYMKDYLSYQLMGMFGVNSPLCSFVNITVNGEVWGLYLAVEGVEEAFLQRNYGSDYGELYKPDSTEMGGGRGNGKNFDIDDWNSENNTSESESSQPEDENNIQTPDLSGNMPPDGFEPGQEMTPPDMEGFDSSQKGSPFGSSQSPDESGTIANSENPEFNEVEESTEDSSDSFNDNFNKDFSDSFSGDIPDGGSFGTEDGTIPDFQNRPDNGGFGGEMGNMNGGMGSDDVSLIYTDDNYDSYSNIFNNAKTDITDEDKDRLIESLKNINENTDIENSVDIEQVIRYFVVHNFVLNFDSYTGIMIHNYYLYESDGVLSMIPWDYNLAFGGFQSSSDATSLVNYPIDSPVSGGTIDSRPMLAWIFNNEEYTELYHQYFEEFITEIFDSGVFSEMMDTVKELISPYVEEDPTKFCTYDEFIIGFDTLKEFCLLRAESISYQLDGTIGSTTEAQQNQENFVDAGDISISDMGSMNNFMGGMGNTGGRDQFGQGINMPDEADIQETPNNNTDVPQGSEENDDFLNSPEEAQSSGKLRGFGKFSDNAAENSQIPNQTSDNSNSESENTEDNFSQPPDSGFQQGNPNIGGRAENWDGFPDTIPEANQSALETESTGYLQTESIIFIVFSIFLLSAAIAFAFLYKRR